MEGHIGASGGVDRHTGDVGDTEVESLRRRVARMDEALRQIQHVIEAALATSPELSGTPQESIEPK